jgi:hypothetical protein
MSEKAALVIKNNNTASNDPCALCGDRTDPAVGPELFVEGTWELVCNPCAFYHAPELWQCLNDYRIALSWRSGDFDDPF